jgi:nucleotide-binding universal stress UspA family protein
MFEKVILAVDGSPYSQRAVQCVAEVAKRSNSEVTVVHVREHELVIGKAGGRFELETAEEAQHVAADAVKELQSKGVKATARVYRAMYGRAPEVILDAAETGGADLIVMGSRGLSDLEGLLVGSVTHKLIHLSKIPVLVAR